MLDYRECMYRNGGDLACMLSGLSMLLVCAIFF